LIGGPLLASERLKTQLAQPNFDRLSCATKIRAYTYSKVGSVQNCSQQHCCRISRIKIDTGMEEADDSNASAVVHKSRSEAEGALSFENSSVSLQGRSHDSTGTV
jgi:hypothetical protein